MNEVQAEEIRQKKNSAEICAAIENLNSADVYHPDIDLSIFRRLRAICLEGESDDRFVAIRLVECLERILNINY